MSAEIIHGDSLDVLPTIAAHSVRRFVGIEREAEYADIARARIAHAQPALGVA